MSLTERARAERKWSSFPHVRKVLEGMELGCEHYGASSISYTRIERIADLWEIALSAIDNAEVLKQLDQELCYRDMDRLRAEIADHATYLHDLAAGMRQTLTRLQA